MTQPVPTPCSSDPDVFFDRGSVAKAKSLCNECPFESFSSCRQAASDNMEAYGVWGGETGPERIGRLIRETAATGDIPRELWTRLMEAVSGGTSTTANQAAMAAGLSLEWVEANTSLDVHETTYKTAEAEAEERRTKFASEEKRKLAEWRKQECVRLAKMGISQSKIAEQLGLSTGTVGVYAKGINPANRPKHEMQRAEVFQLLNDGATISGVAASLGMSERSVYRYKMEWVEAGGIYKPQREVVISIPPMPKLERSRKATTESIDYETVWRMTHEQKSKTEIALATGFSVAAVQRARAKLSAATLGAVA